MKILYHCYGGSHSSVVSAAIHLGLLCRNRLPEQRELLSIPYYDAQVNLDHGHIRFFGFDKAGNEVYIVGRHGLGDFYETILSRVLKLDADDISNIFFINTMSCVNIFMVIGGYLSRCWNSTWLGRRIVIFGTRRSFWKFVQLVEQVELKLEHREI